MKMLLIVFRDSLEQEIHQQLKDLGIKAFTEAPKLLGAGEAGTALNTFDWPGTNAMVFAVVEDGQATRVVQGLKVLRERMSEQQHGAKIPMRVFVIPCELAV